MLPVLLNRFFAAFAHAPTGADWCVAGFSLFLVAAFALPIGFRGGFLCIEQAAISRREAVGVALLTFFAPALGEEVLFRVLLLPRFATETPPMAQAFWVVVSVGAFAVYHPLKAWLSKARQTQHRGDAVYTSPVFLRMTAIIGLACAVSYIRSGSVWPPVVIHWVCVAVWLLTLGGLRRMNSAPSSDA